MRPRSQVTAHTLPKELQAGGVCGAAGVWTRRGGQHEAAGAGGVLAGTLTGFLLQGGKPAGYMIQILLSKYIYIHPNKLKGFQSPGRADSKGVSLTVVLGALRLAALRIQIFNHCS